MAEMSSKRAAKESKAGAEKCTHNGLKLSASRRLPSSLEGEVLSFAAVRDLAALLQTSGDMRALVHGWLRTTPRLTIDLVTSCDITYNKQGSCVDARLLPDLRIVLKAVQSCCSQLQTLEVEDRSKWARLDTSTVLSPHWLVAVLNANSSTLRHVRAQIVELWTEETFAALANCAELRSLRDPSGRDRIDSKLHPLFRMVADSCPKIECLHCPCLGDDQLDLVQASLQLVDVTLLVRVLDNPDTLPLLTALSRHHATLRSLVIELEFLGGIHCTVLTAVCEELLPQLTELEKLKVSNSVFYRPEQQFSPTRVLKMPALKLLLWTAPFRLRLDAPQLTRTDMLLPEDCEWLQTSPNLERLHLTSRWDQPSDGDPRFLLNAGGAARWPQLRELNIIVQLTVASPSSGPAAHSQTHASAEQKQPCRRDSLSSIARMRILNVGRSVNKARRVAWCVTRSLANERKH